MAVRGRAFKGGAAGDDERGVDLRFVLACFLSIGLAAAPVAAQEGQTCDAGAVRPAVSLVILASAKKVQELAASVRDVRVLRRDAKTVVFENGRILTADVAAVGEHLNALGWASRRIEVLASFTAAPPARSARAPTAEARSAGPGGLPDPAARSLGRNSANAG